ncbi:unnamed protein product [Citrullus colocynthis]|uniref:Uncharacterized protein n=1 Tax=Citrullus colocynthis TaxID=252529 RepID=A0ABP0YKU3_9ROSI
MMTMVMVVGGIKGKVSGELGSHPFLCVTFLKIFLMFSFACNTKSNACIENLFVAGHDVSLENILQLFPSFVIPYFILLYLFKYICMRMCKFYIYLSLSLILLIFSFFFN